MEAARSDFAAQGAEVGSDQQAALVTFLRPLSRTPGPREACLRVSGLRGHRRSQTSADAGAVAAWSVGMPQADPRSSPRARLQGSSLSLAEGSIDMHLRD